MRRSIALAVALGAAPALASIHAPHFAGTLLAQAEVEVDPAVPSDTPLDRMTREQLKAELQRLDENKVNFVGPVVMAAVGGGVAILGVVFLAYGFIFYVIPTASGAAGLVPALVTAGIVFFAVGAAAIIAGGILLTVGLVRLFPALAVRRQNSERRDDINRRLEELDTVPPPARVPPPPPPPPPPRGYLNVEPSVVLATF